MRYYLTLTLFFIFSIAASGQNKLKSETVKDTAIISLQANLNFAKDEVTDFKFFPSEKIIKNVTLELRAGDIIINYELDRKKKGAYKIYLEEIKNLSTDSIFFIKPENLYGDFGNAISKSRTTQKQIIIANTPDNDNIKWLNGEIQIKMQVQHYVTVVGNRAYDCNAPEPQLHLKDFTIEMIVSSVGIGTLITGYVIDGNSDRLYEDYINSDNKTEADPIFNEANKKHQRALVTKAIGAGIITGVIISTVMKFYNHRQDKKYYNRYCKKLTVEPFYNSNRTLAAPKGKSGISIKYKF